MGCCLGALWEPGADGGRGNGSLFRTAVRCACQHLLPCKQRGGSYFGDVTGTTAGKHLPPCFFNESQGFVPLLGHRSLAAEVCESCKPSRVLWRQEISYCAKLLVEICFVAFLKEVLLAGRQLCHSALPSQESALAKCKKSEPPYTSEMH